MKLNEFLSHNYVPYSHQPHVAIVRSREGRIFPGVKIENLSYPVSIGASKTALFSCLSEGQEPVELATTHNNDGLISFWKEEFDLSVQNLDPQHLPDEKVCDISIKLAIDPHAKLQSLVNHKLAYESNFPVAALIETESGYFSGVNVECSAWDMGLCAERLALFKAMTYGCNKFKSLHVHTRKGEFSSPCGACRQVIIEHMRNRQIHLHHADGSTSVHFINDLLPYSFCTSTLTSNNK